MEFLLVFPPLFFLFLILLQSAILRVCDLGVRHAASATVRAAIVVLPDDPRHYEGAPINLIPREASCGSGVLGKIYALAKRLGIGEGGGVLADDGRCPGGPRMADIHFAAVMRMLPFSPSPAAIAPGAFRGTLSRLGTLGELTGAAAYAYGATAVTFANLDESAAVIDAGSADELTVRVTYLAYCGIPAARIFMCDSGRELGIPLGILDDIDLLRRSSTDLRASRSVRRRRERARRGIGDLRRAAASPSLFVALLFSGARFRVLQAEATLPLVTSAYQFPE